MIDVPKLIQEAQDVLQDRQIGFVAEIKIPIQQCNGAAVKYSNPCELSCILRYNKKLRQSQSNVLNIDRLVKTAEDVMTAVAVGIPLPVTRKVQSFEYTVSGARQVYDLLIHMAPVQAIKWKAYHGND